ncbi:hypothetical protein [Micromonospora sp. DT47]|uniref:hypothetical protein n=1 Tax=Micromonospora sp. DT47 TaxID=3393431 RepID=UPI003CF21689
MDVEAVRVEGYHEVLALHRMLMECKSDDLGSVYAGSPFIAAIQHRLADALEAADPSREWRNWRRADAHPHRVKAVRDHVAEAGKWWQDASEEQRAAYVGDLLAPLQPSQELLAELTAVTATDDSNGTGRTDAAADE